MVKKKDWKKSFNKAMCAIKLPHIESQSGEAKEIDKSKIDPISELLRKATNSAKNFNRALRNAQQSE